MHDLMRSHPFATLVSSAVGHLSADHVPLVLHADDQQKAVLQGHVAAANPLFRETEGPIEVMAIFQGPQSYITPSWYASKKEHGKVVPTWNYVVVHARGTLRFIREADWLLTHLNDLTNQHESHRETPWAVSDAPDDFVARQLKGLVGFEIEVVDLAGTWKVSQNKTAADNKGVQTGLRGEGDPQKVLISDLVQERERSK
jgi:transcriptional regulator